MADWGGGGGRGRSVLKAFVNRLRWDESLSLKHKAEEAMQTEKRIEANSDCKAEIHGNQAKQCMYFTSVKRNRTTHDNEEIYTKIMSFINNPVSRHNKLL